MENGQKIVAMCTSRIFDIQNHAFIKKLNEELKKDNIRLLVYALNIDLYWDEESEHTEAYLFDMVPMWKIDALLYMDEKIKCKRLARHVIENAKHYNVPVLVADGEYEGCTTVRFDFKRGFEKLVRHIIEEHHVRRPHFMAGIRNNPFSDERIDIFKKVIAENGIEFNDDMLSYGDFWAIPARKAMNEVLDKGIVPEAVICANDFMAINVISVLKERGYSVPGQVLVSGFDGEDEARMCEPDITTGDCNTVALADMSSFILKRLIRHEEVDNEYKVMPRLVKGNSCGCPSATIGSVRLLDMVNDKSYRYQDDIQQFYEMTMRMQMSETVDEMSKNIYAGRLSDMICVVNSLCFDREVDYFRYKQDLSRPPEKGISLLYDSKTKCPVRELGYDELLAIALERVKDHPLIFNLMHYLKQPLGYLCFTFDSYDVSEYAKTSSVSNYMSLGLGGFVNMRYQQYLFQKLEDSYRFDHLTGLYNRQGFSNALEKLKEKHADEGGKFTVIMADLDGLKPINDNFGHDAGDNAIAVSAKALKDSCPEHALCLRFGGDEMCAFIYGGCDIDAVIKSIDEKLDAYNATSGLKYKITASCGGCHTVLTGDCEMEGLVRKADEAMYANKRDRKSDQ